MATETATDALYQALSSSEPDTKIVHAAIEEVRYLSGRNVIAAIEAKIDVRVSDLDVRFSRIESQITEVKAEIKAQTSRIDVLQRVIWPLIGLLATTVFGLLYEAVTSS